jgi:hypothetical protein
MRHYYVYYRVEAADSRHLEPLVRVMQSRLRCRTGVTGRLLKQCGNELLWMEVYDNVEQPEPFENALQKAVSEFEIEVFLDRRITECFSD